MTRQSGFTLVETLLVVVIAGMAVVAIAGAIDVARRGAESARRAEAMGVYTGLVVEWWRESVEGLTADDIAPTTVGKYELSGFSLAPLGAPGGSGRAIRWRLGREGSGPWRLEYAESGTPSWTFELDGVDEAWFAAGPLGDPLRKPRSRIDRPLQVPSRILLVLVDERGERSFIAVPRGREAPIIDWAENVDD